MRPRWSRRATRPGPYRRPDHDACPAPLYFSGHFPASSASPAVAGLLFPVGADRVPPMVPHERRGWKPMVHSRAVKRQQTSTSSPAVRNLGSNPPMASSELFLKACCSRARARLAVGEEHVNRPARRQRHGVGDEPVARGGRFGPRPRRGRSSRTSRHVAKPVGVGPRVVVDVGDDLARRRAQPGVARRCRARGSVC